MFPILKGLNTNRHLVIILKPKISVEGQIEPAGLPLRALIKGGAPFTWPLAR